MAAALAATVLCASAQATVYGEFGLTDHNEVFGLGSSALMPISGLGAGETLLAIDQSPVNAHLYGMTATRLYDIDLDHLSATPVTPLGAFSLTGTSFDMDVRSKFGYVRMISETGQNLRVNVDTGAVAADPAFTYLAGDPNSGQQPHIVAIAYSENYFGGQGGRLFGVDSGQDVLVRIDELGRLTTVGSLGIDISDDAAFDISGSTGIATLMTMPSGASTPSFYLVDVNNRRTLLQPWLSARLDGGIRVVDLSLTTVPEPASWAMMLVGFGALGSAIRRRRPAPAGLLAAA